MADRVTRILRRSDRISDRAYKASRKGKSRKADRLRRKSSKVAAKARGVACKINARGRKTCKRVKRSNRGFNPRKY
tara:strand:- start:5791 stop:6018 length:228 start_codon:yes stop_codon:yes gene_type:complete